MTTSRKVLDMKTCLDAMEDAYRDLSKNEAAYRPRIDFYVPREPHYYRWGTMEGATRSLGYMAIRMKSDMLVWEKDGEFETEDKYCIEPGTYCGLIFLLSVRNGEPLALMNDGYLQHMRVGACAGTRGQVPLPPGLEGAGHAGLGRHGADLHPGHPRGAGHRAAAGVQPHQGQPGSLRRGDARAARPQRSRPATTPRPRAAARTSWRWPRTPLSR